jgi:hypothetical protein
LRKTGELKEEELEEMSSMAGGAVEGYAGSAEDPERKRKPSGLIREED